MLPLGGFFLWGIRSKPKKSVGYSHWTSLNLQNHPMFYAKVCGGHGLLYACTANINISTGRLSSSFRSDMTKLNVKKRAFEAPLKFAKVLKHPKVKKLPLQPHKKHSHFLCYVFFGAICVTANRQPLGLPGQAIVSVQEAAGAQEVHGGRVTAHLDEG